MGSVYRKTVTKKLPAGGEIFTRKGQRFIRWADAKGKSRTAPITVGKQGEDRVVILAKTFTAKFRDGQGKVCEIATGCKDETAARAVLAGLVKRSERVKSGLVSPREDAVVDFRGSLLEASIRDYEARLKATDSSPGYRKNTMAHLRRMFAECGFRTFADLTAPPVERWLADHAEGEDALSARTRNAYRSSLVTFADWCVSKHRLTGNPFTGLPTADEKAGRSRERRALNENELRMLLHVARLRPLAEYGRRTVRTEKPDDKRKRSGWTYAPLEIADLDAAEKRARDRLKAKPEFIEQLERLGRERALIYKTLVLTGLRKGELASLTIGRLNLTGEHPHAVLDAADEKNRQGSTIPLRGDLAADLASWVEERRQRSVRGIGGADVLKMAKEASVLPADETVFTVPDKLVTVLDRDLKLAGIAKRDELGRTVDVHALRHSFCTLMSVGGVAPRTAQAAMRHSNINLTMTTYTDPRLLDVHGAMDSLPALPLNSEPSLVAEERKATGTDGRFAPGFAPATDHSCTPHPTRPGFFRRCPRMQRRSKSNSAKPPSNASRTASPRLTAWRLLNSKSMGHSIRSKGLRRKRSRSCTPAVILTVTINRPVRARSSAIWLIAHFVARSSQQK